MSDICIKCQNPKERTVCCNKILHCKECNRIRALDCYNSHKENRQQKTMLYYYENKEKVIRKQKERRESDKNEFNRKQRERYNRKKVETLLNRFEAIEIEVVGYYVLLYV